MRAAQVQKLSVDDGGAYHRALYMRNLSSSDLAGEDDEDMQPPARLEGDIIRFSRCAGSHYVFIGLKGRI